MIDWNKEFPISSVTRIDLKEAGIPEAVIANLSDEEMEAIARKMGEYYVDQRFWDHISPTVEYVLERKQAHD